MRLMPKAQGTRRQGTRKSQEVKAQGRHKVQEDKTQERHKVQEVKTQGRTNNHEIKKVLRIPPLGGQGGGPGGSIHQNKSASHTFFALIFCYHVSS
jgi:hypothetical protein